MIKDWSLIVKHPLNYLAVNGVFDNFFLKKIILLLLLTLGSFHRTAEAHEMLYERSFGHELSAPSDSLDYWIGRMLMIGFRGFSVSENDHILRDLQEYHVGGIILFDYDVPSRTPIRNIESPTQVKTLIEELKSSTEVPLLIAVDQEGGRVARLKEARGFLPSRSAAQLNELSLRHPDSVSLEYDRQAQQLRDLGFNVNFAPVVDLNVNPENPVIGKLERSYSADSEQVTLLARQMLESLRKAGLTGVLKHFPGHGSSMNDSHLGVTEVTQTWQPEELAPYRELISSGHAQAIMSAHVFHAEFDSLYPGTLSPYVNKILLRDELGFNGVLFSDDLQMGAIRDQFTLEETLLLALNSGIDVMVFGNNASYDPDIVPKVHGIIRNAVLKGEVQEDRLKSSAKRIERLTSELRK